MALDEGLEIGGCGRLADGVGHVDRVEVAGVDEAIHGLEVDVVGVHVVRPFPAQLAHGRIGGGAYAGRFRADDGVFAIRLVPDGNDGCAVLRGHDAGLQLRLGLVREAVADAEGEFVQGKHDCGSTQIIIQERI